MGYDFRKINFGSVDAQSESQDSPELLTNGYYDHERAIEAAKNSAKFLFLGYKGSGKSALSEHLRLSAGDDELVDLTTMANFSYKSLGKIVSGNSIEEEVKLRLAWRWVLLAKILCNLYDKDKAAKSDIHSDVDKAVCFLTQSGVLPITDISAIVAKSSTNQFKARLKEGPVSVGFEQKVKSENAEVCFEQLVDFIKRVVFSYSEMRKQYVVIDGLDEILTQKEIQYKSTVALINEAKDLNAEFRNNSFPIKIIVLCRTDIFERLPDPNKNKIKQSLSYTFSWYDEGIDTQKQCGLVQIANLRTRLVYDDVEDVFARFFPAKYQRKEIYAALLDFTRHTPRDFMMLLSCIQKHCKKRSVDSNSIKAGIASYSSDYFVSEVKDELACYVDYKYIDGIIALLASQRRPELDYSKLKTTFAHTSELDGLDLDDVLKILFDCSAIGQLYRYRDNDSRRVSFKYRNHNSTFAPNDDIMLHKGLYKALNVNY